VAAALPSGAAIGGWAASMLHGTPYLDGEDAPGNPLPIPVCLSRDQTCRRMQGQQVWRSDLGDDDVVEIEGIPVTSVVRTAFDLARWRPPLAASKVGLAVVVEAVVLVDGLITATHLSPDEVREYAERHRKRHGLGQARQVLGLVVPGSRSPGETRFRVFWEVEAGLPRPLVNPRVVDRNGVLLGCVDLADPQAGMVGEYDGAYHADAWQRSMDGAREQGLVASGLVVVRATGPDLGPHRRRTIFRLQEAHRRGMSRDRRRDQWRIVA